MRLKILLLCVFTLAPMVAWASELIDARLSIEPDSGDARMVLEFDDEAGEIDGLSLGQPPRLMFTLPGARTMLEGRGRAHAVPGVGPLEISTPPGGVRLLLELTKPHGYRVERHGRRIEVVLEPSSAPVVAEAAPVRPLPVNVERVVVAPPSGGDTPVSLDFQRLPVRAALSLLAEAGGVDLVVADGVEGELTLRLESIPWSRALALVLEGQGLASRRHGDALLVAPAAAIEAIAAREARPLGDEQALALDMLKVDYARAEDVASLLEGGGGAGLLSPRGWIGFDARTNTLLVQDTPTRLAGIRRALAELDVPLRQVQIEARIVIARERVSRQLGIRWGEAGIGRAFSEGIASERRGFSPGGEGSGPFLGLGFELGGTASPQGAFTVGLVNSNVLLALELNALEREGMSHTLSQPRVVTLDREPAMIRQGQEVPYQESGAYGSTSTSFRDAVLALEVLPQLTPDGRIRMAVDVQNDSVAGDRFNGLPAIDTSRISTQVLVDNGETVVLGGILTSEQANELHKLPWLGDLPLLGGLFRRAERARERVELLVFITPNIIEDQRAAR